MPTFRQVMKANLNKNQLNQTKTFTQSQLQKNLLQPPQNYESESQKLEEKRMQMNNMVMLKEQPMFMNKFEQTEIIRRGQRALKQSDIQTQIQLFHNITQKDIIKLDIQLMKSNRSSGWTQISLSSCEIDREINPENIKNMKQKDNNGNKNGRKGNDKGKCW